MEKETYKPQDEQAENTNHDTLQDMPSFEEHMNNIENEKNHDKYAEIEANIAEITSDKHTEVNIFVKRKKDEFGGQMTISNYNPFGKKCGDKIKHKNGEIEDRKMSEQYALWRVAKDIASSITLDDPQNVQEKALRDFSVLERLWVGKPSSELKSFYNKQIAALEQEKNELSNRPDPYISVKLRDIIITIEKKDRIFIASR